ncbi:hypothetical protein [Nocardioides cynanchi]|uniref:hypothetical protein n=1 Tax=Nocardioides cynanchi TaxID=2558918 RepID=UPI001245E6A5|nr:hypothetical protein [Nocardioides cynanchi]
MSEAGAWVRERKPQFLALLVGAVLGTVLWFALSPYLSHDQEHALSWLLLGGNFVLLWLMLRVQRTRRGRRGSP